MPGRRNCRSRSKFVVLNLLWLTAGLLGFSPAWGQNRFERDLSEALNAQLSNSGLEVRGEARQKLDELVRVGARQLAADGASKEQMVQARENAAVLAREIAALAQRGKRGEVTSGDVESAAKRVCPLYPFCRKGPG